MKKVVILLCCVFIFGGLFHTTTYAVKEDFFYWMDGYVAVPTESVSSIVLKYCFPQNESQVDFQQIESVSFQGITPNVLVQNFYASPVMEGVSGYQYVDFTLDIFYPTEGIFKAEFLRVHYKDGSRTVYPIGEWWFDVGVEEQFPELLDTSASDTTSESSEHMPYQYKLLNDNIKIYQLAYGDRWLTLSMTGVAPVGKVDLNCSQAPVKYVKTKMQVAENNSRYSWIYGKGCYCGNLNMTEEGTALSFEYMNNKMAYK